MEVFRVGRHHQGSDPRVVFERQLSPFRNGYSFLELKLSSSQPLLVGSEGCRAPEVNAILKGWVPLQGRGSYRTKQAPRDGEFGGSNVRPYLKCMITICCVFSETL